MKILIKAGETFNWEKGWEFGGERKIANQIVLN